MLVRKLPAAMVIADLRFQGVTAAYASCTAGWASPLSASKSSKGRGSSAEDIQCSAPTQLCSTLPSIALHPNPSHTPSVSDFAATATRHFCCCSCCCCFCPPAPAPSPATKSSAASLPPPHSQTGRYRPPANAASMFRHTETAGQPLRSSCDEPEVSIPSGPGAADATVEVAADAAAAAAVAAELPEQLGVKAAAEGLRRICWPSRVPGGPAGMGSAKASTDRMAAGVWWAHKCWWWVGLSMGGGHPGAHCCQHCMACH